MKADEGSSGMVPFFGAFETALILDVAGVVCGVPGMINSKGFQGTLLDVSVLHRESALLAWWCVEEGGKVGLVGLLLSKLARKR